jgi:hypothetical protein
VAFHHVSVLLAFTINVLRRSCALLIQHHRRRQRVRQQWTGAGIIIIAAATNDSSCSNTGNMFAAAQAMAIQVPRAGLDA